MKLFHDPIAFSVNLHPSFSLLLPFPLFLLELLSPIYIFFKHLFATLTAKLSTNEDVSTPVKFWDTSDLAGGKRSASLVDSTNWKNDGTTASQSDLGAN